MSGREYHQTVSDLLVEELKKGNAAKIRITSPSMAPILKPGDRITIKRIPGQDLKPGDMILVRREADFLTHRLIQNNNGVYITKSDNNPIPDAPVASDAILGIVVALQREQRTRTINTPYYKVLNRMMGFISNYEVKVAQFSKIAWYPLRGMITILQFIYR